MRRLLSVVFSLTPLFFLIAIGEIALRALDLDQARLDSLPIPGEIYGAIIPDELLLWAGRPYASVHVVTPRGEMDVTTNRLGLRGKEVFPKRDNEFRILSLGESSTFGAFVNDDETYSVRLQEFLNQGSSKHRFRVINAGVSAYSSFQSLLYLRHRGIALDPDLVLFYHEYNDYLPSSLRTSGNSEFGIARTDMELYESMRGAVSRNLLARSAIFRFLSYRLASYKIRALRRSSERKSADAIGLDDLHALPKIVHRELGGETSAQIDHSTLPRRVSSEERVQILEELRDFCEKQGIALVIIHPAYRNTKPHDCEQTRFCRAEGVAMVDAYDALHRSGYPAEAIYVDNVHPRPLGHTLLARAIEEFLRQEALIPTD